MLAIKLYTQCMGLALWTILWRRKSTACFLCGYVYARKEGRNPLSPTVLVGGLVAALRLMGSREAEGWRNKKRSPQKRTPPKGGPGAKPPKKRGAGGEAPAFAPQRESKSNSRPQADMRRRRTPLPAADRGRSRLCRAKARGVSKRGTAKPSLFSYLGGTGPP